ncbi:MAG: Lar family restriction alleviation protein [Victivallaceae bacterium]|nr:Lar family restriction alleviation protein [Victivallaceae bacterium]
MSKKKKEKLKPCPFCGSENLTINHDYYPSWISCEGCGSLGPEDEDTQEAEKKWNTRIINP